MGSIKLRGYWLHHGRVNFSHYVHTMFRWSLSWTTGFQYWREAQNIYFGFCFDLIECLNIFWKPLSQILSLHPLNFPGNRVSMVCTHHENNNIWLRLYPDLPFFMLRVLTVTFSWSIWSSNALSPISLIARKNRGTSFGKA